MDYQTGFAATTYLPLNMKQKDKKVKEKSMDIRLSKSYRSTEVNQEKLKTYLQTTTPSKS